MTIQDKNIVIAEFMGMSQTEMETEVLKIKWTIWELPTEDPNFSFLSRHEHLIFDTDYNWLMKAWVKFRDIKVDLNNLVKHEALCEGLMYWICNGTISEAFEALYEAVNWLNSLKK